VHVPHHINLTAVKSTFTVNGKKYHWKDHIELVEDESNVIVATFVPAWIEDYGHRLGKLVIKSDARNMMDMVVITLLVLQERADEDTVSVRVFLRIIG